MHFRTKVTEKISPEKYRKRSHQHNVFSGRINQTEQLTRLSRINKILLTNVITCGKYLSVRSQFRFRNAVDFQSFVGGKRLRCVRCTGEVDCLALQVDWHLSPLKVEKPYCYNTVILK